jgi:hypothetical protein
VQDVFGAVYDDFASGFAYVLDFLKDNFGAAWADAVDAFNACSYESGADAVQACRYGYGACGSVVLAVQVDFDPADATGFLEFSKV